jgi:hypothetical protein
MNLKTYLKGLGLGIFVTTLITSVSSGNTKTTMTDSEIMARAEELGMVSENAMLLSQAQKLADDAAEKARASANEAQKSTSGDMADKADEKDVSKAAPSVNTVSQAASRNSVSASGTDTASVSALKAGTKEDKTAGGNSTDNKNSTGNSDSSKETASASAEATKAAKATESKATEAKPSEASESQKKTGTDDAGVVPGSGEIVTVTISSGDSSVSVANKMVQAGLVTDARQFDSYLVLNGYDRKLVVGSHPIPKGASPEEMGSILTSKQ